jgi:hypothetical protein
MSDGRALEARIGSGEVVNVSAPGTTWFVEVGSSCIDVALNLAAQAALRRMSPLRAMRWMKRIASLLPEIDSASAARSSLQKIERRGTCLSRSIAVAARCVNAQVIVGVQVTPETGPVQARSTTSQPREPCVEIRGSGPVSGPVLARGCTGASSPKRRVRAHAWLEFEGASIEDATKVGWIEIGRFPAFGNGQVRGVAEKALASDFNRRYWSK